MKTIKLAAMAAALAAVLLFAISGCGFSDKAAQDGDVDSTEYETSDNDFAPIKLINVKEPSNWNPNTARKPTAIHITYQRDPSRYATLQWQTEEKDEASYVPKVWLARGSDVKDADYTVYEQTVKMPYAEALTATGSAEKYCQKLFCSDETSYAGLQWSVEIALPDPDAVYYYRVGTWESFDESTGEFKNADLSPAYHFKSGLPKGSKQPFVFGFGSDSQNWFENITEKADYIRKNTGKEARFWLFGGDLTEMGTQEELWGWFDVMQPILHYFSFMPVSGNHDIFQGALFGEFSLPRMDALPEEIREFAWSFNYGSLHVLAFHSNGESTVEEQLDFIEKDLKAASEDPDIEWKIAMFHHPMYSSSTAHGSTDYLQSLVRPLFDAYKVDLTFSGHDHDYERTKPMRGGQIMDSGEGTVYVVSGGFFSKKSYGNGTSDFTAVSFDGESKSYVTVEINGKTLKGTAYNGQHELLDSFTLTK